MTASVIAMMLCVFSIVVLLVTVATFKNFPVIALGGLMLAPCIFLTLAVYLEFNKIAVVEMIVCAVYYVCGVSLYLFKRRSELIRQTAYYKEHMDHEIAHHKTIYNKGKFNSENHAIYNERIERVYFKSNIDTAVVLVWPFIVVGDAFATGKKLIVKFFNTEERASNRIQKHLRNLH